MMGHERVSAPNEEHEEALVFVQEFHVEHHEHEESRVHSLQVRYPVQHAVDGLDHVTAAGHDEENAQTPVSGHQVHLLELLDTHDEHVLAAHWAAATAARTFGAAAAVNLTESSRFESKLVGERF